MMHRLRRIIAAAALALLSLLAPQLDSAAQTSRPLRFNDFRYSAPLSLDSGSAIHQAILPLAVYQGSVRADLGDLRVFNADGEVVPYAIRRPAAATAARPSQVNLPFFPIYADAPGELQDLQLQVRRDAGGTIVDLKSADRRSGQARLAAYLVDASAVRQALESLEFEWAQPNASSSSFSGALKVEASDDLAHWHELVTAAPVARFEFQGHRLEQRKVALPAASAKYWRISWPAAQAPLEIGALRGEVAGTVSEAPREWLSVSGSALADKPGEYAFDLGAHVPVDRVRIDLPQNNTLAEASLLRRSSMQSPWQPVTSAVLYRLLHAGQEVRSADLAVGPHTARYWLLRVDQRGGGIGRAAPSLRAGWLPNQLLFIARGAPPFKLAYGAVNVGSAEVAIDHLLPGYQQGGALTALRAEVGAPTELMSVPATAPKPPLPWKKYILWTTLVLAVALLGWMAYRLTRQMESRKP